MDPYQTLGVSRDSTREKVKEVFRARVRLVHPDRGGEIPEFIRLRKAYEQILADLDRSPVPTDLKTAPPPPRQNHPRQPWAPKRGPEIVWLDERPHRDRPIKPPDPNWVPDFVLLDEDPARIRPVRPPDPNWVPDFVLLDEDPCYARSAEPPNSGAARQGYDAWLRQLAARLSQRCPSWLPRSFGAVWIVMLLIATLVLVVTLILA
jgi:hypothetical protein